jgi:protein phosphatase
MPPNNQPIAAVRLQIGHGSDPGRERAENQDCYGVAASRQSTTRVASRGVWHVVEKRFLEERGQLFIVADGIGGHNAGELASELAVKSVLRDYYSLPFASPVASLQQAIIAAGQEVLARSESGDQALAGMGTTVTALVVRGNQAILAHVGDSRCYRINYEKIEQQTQDHTWVREQIQAGVLTEEEAQRHPYRHVLSRSLGRSDSAPDVLT